MSMNFNEAHYERSNAEVRRLNPASELLSGQQIIRGRAVWVSEWKSPVVAKRETLEGLGVGLGSGSMCEVH